MDVVLKVIDLYAKLGECMIKPQSPAVHMTLLMTILTARSATQSSAVSNSLTTENDELMLEMMV